MTIENFTPLPALVGGLLIGLSASIVLGVHGRVAGISGVVGRLLSAAHGDGFDRWFLAGLLAAGVVGGLVAPGVMGEALAGRGQLVAAGLLVGLGTRLANGCTSGHGVCGLSRGSPRSLAATLTFMATGVLTVWLTRHAIGGAP